jgi:hypothetical protein
MPIPNSWLHKKQYNSRCYGTAHGHVSLASRKHNTRRDVFCEVCAAITQRGGHFWNQEDRKRPPLVAVTKQRLGKAEETSSALQRQCDLWNAYVVPVRSHECKSITIADSNLSIVTKHVILCYDFLLSMQGEVLQELVTDSTNNSVRRRWPCRQYSLLTIAISMQILVFYLKQLTGRFTTAGAQSCSPDMAMCNLWLTKLHYGGFPPSTSVSLANSHSSNCSIFLLHHGPGVNSASN